MRDVIGNGCIRQALPLTRGMAAHRRRRGARREIVQALLIFKDAAMASIFLMLGLALGLASAAANAQQVFKCNDAGAITYQSAPCQGETLRSWNAVPEQATAPAAQRTSRSPQARPAARRARQHRGTHATRIPAASACERARRGRDQAYAKAGLKRDFKLSSDWDNRIHDACR